MPSFQGLFPNGNIATATFVKLDSGNVGMILQAGSGDVPCGISVDAPRAIAFGSFDSGNAAIAGDPSLRVFQDGTKQCRLNITATVTPGLFIKPDALGYGIPTTAATDWYGARAITGGAANETITVEVITGQGTN